MSRDTKTFPTFRARERIGSIFAPIAPLVFRQTIRRGFCPYRISSPRKRSGFDRPLRFDRRKSPSRFAETPFFRITLLAGDKTAARNWPACVSSPRGRRRQPRVWFDCFYRGRRPDRALLSIGRDRLKRRTIDRRKRLRPGLAPRPRCRSYVARNRYFRGLNRRARFSIANFR